MHQLRTSILSIIIVYLAITLVCLSVPKFDGESQSIEPIKESVTKVKSDVADSFIMEPIETTTTPSTEPNFARTEPIEYVTYFDVPLDEYLQDHIFAVCRWYDIDPALVIAIIDRESDFRPSLRGDNGASYGLMQIQLRWHEDRMISLGHSDLLNPYVNIVVGVDYLAELFERGKPVEWVLMAYNGGPSYANKKFAKGEVSVYARTVLENSTKLATYEKIKK